MTSGAATMLGPGRRRHRARAARAGAPGYRGPPAPRGRMGRPDDRGRARAAGRDVRRSSRSRPDAEEDHAPLYAVPPVALLAFALARLRGHNPDRPDWIERYHSQGLRHILGLGSTGSGDRRDDPDRAGRRGQRRVHPQPPGRHPVVRRAPRRRARPPRHRRRPPRDRRADGATGPADALGATPSIAAHLDRRTALEGADFVIDTIQVGGARATQLDFEIPERYGLQYTINDTIDIGGVMRGLRTIPVVLGIAADMADVCPDALFLNYTNPMGMLVRAVDEAVAFPTVGLCHSVYWTIHDLADYARRPVRGGRRALGRRQPPRLDPPARASRPRPVPGPPGVRRRRPGPRRRPRPRGPVQALRLLPQRGGRPAGRVQRRGTSRRPARSSATRSPSASTSSRVANHLEEYAETKRMLDAGEPFEIERSGEYAAVIINAIVTGQPARIVANVMNDGGATDRRTSPATRASRSRRSSTASASTPRPSGPCRPSAPRTRARRSTARSSRSGPRSTATATSSTTP